jgi:hypothetical protein
MFGAKTKGNTQPQWSNASLIWYTISVSVLTKYPPIAKLLIFDILQKYFNLSNFVFI